MTRTPRFANPDWSGLEARHRGRVVRPVRRGFERGGDPLFQPATVSNTHPAEAETLLRELAGEGGGGSWLRYTPRFRCAHCDTDLRPDDHDAQLCPDTNCPTHTDGEPWSEEELPAWRLIDPEPVRRAGWLVALHGMNTRGAWQEAFNWMVARSYGQMVPVAVYKYGIVRPGAFVRRLQRRHVERLAARLRAYRSQAEIAGFREPPDVIAHSLGTWLLGHALLENARSPGQAPLQVGRVVLTGSILRPNFPWEELLDAEPPRVEAVLNHYGTRDGWALVAQWAIPDAGPSGRRGFDAADARVLNLEAPGFTHSQFFYDDEMPALFAGPWSQFLSRPLDRVRERLGARDPDKAWRPAPWLLRARLPRWLLLAVALALVLLLVAALPLGVRAAAADPGRGLEAAGTLVAAALSLELLRRGSRWLARRAPWPW